MHMSQTGTSTKQQKDDGSATKVDMKLEVDIIPVSDVERSKQFYKRLGWRFDDDAAPTNGIRIVQFTPPGSRCSVTFGKGLTAAAPGSAVASTRVRCGTDRRSPRRHGSAEPTPSARATGRSAPLTILTAIRG